VIASSVVCREVSEVELLCSPEIQAYYQPFHTFMSQMDTTPGSPSLSSSVRLEASTFKHRRIGRCASPPVWVREPSGYLYMALTFCNTQGCYELDVNDSENESVSQSESDEEEGISVIISSEVDPVNIPLPPSPVPIIILMDSESPQDPLLLDADQGAAETIMISDSLPAVVADADALPGDTPQTKESPQETQDESCSTDCGRQKIDKGKGREVVPDSPQSPTSSVDQQCVPQTPSSRVSRRAQRTQRRGPKYQPILTIRSSHGWIWNQVGNG